MQFDAQRVEEAAHGMLGGIVASRSGNAHLAAKAIDADEAAPGLFEVRQSIIGAIDRLHTMRAEIDLNYMGTVYCTYYALPYLKQTRGRLVGVNSFGGQVGIPGTAGYNASKHAMRGFLNTLRVELHGTGVTVSVAYLGAVRTERLKKTMGDNVNKIPTMDPKRVAALIIQQAARRQRQQVMTFPGKLLRWLNKCSPTLLDRILVSIRSISYQE